jgi:hypothetical protein
MTAISSASVTESHETANPFPDLPAIRGAEAKPQPPRPAEPATRRFPSPRFGDYSRTRFESRVAFGGPDEDAEEVATPTRQFSILEITSGLPDDSREEDERAAERRLRDLRGRVKAARAAISATPGAEATLRRHWVKAAHFYARFGITEGLLRLGVPADCLHDADGELEGQRRHHSGPQTAGPAPRVLHEVQGNVLLSGTESPTDA